MASASGLDRGWCLAPPPQRSPWCIESMGTARDGRHRDGRLSRPRSEGGRPCRSFTCRSCASWLQAPCDRRPARHTAGRLGDRGKSARRHAADPVTGRDPTYEGIARSSPQSAQTAVRRPRLRLRQVPPLVVGARDQARHRQTRGRTRLGPWAHQVASRAHIRLAPSVQTAADPLRAPCRSPPRAAGAGPAESSAFADSGRHFETISKRSDPRSSLKGGSRHRLGQMMRAVPRRWDCSVKRPWSASGRAPLGGRRSPDSACPPGSTGRPRGTACPSRGA